MKQQLESIFGKSFRTAIVGWSKGLLLIGADVFNAFQQGKFTGIHGVALAIGVLIVINGIVSKDAMVTSTPTQLANDELTAAQAALAVANSTGDKNLIKMAQDVVDNLKKNF